MLRDLLSRLSGYTIAIVAIAMFLAGAVAGFSMIDRLGGAGWAIYAILITAYGLLFGPMLASAFTMHQRGSRRHREALEARLVEQRRRYARHLKSDRPDPGD